MTIKIRQKEDTELNSLRIEKDGKEFLIKDVPGGIEVSSTDLESIMIQPRVANSILIVTN